MYVIAGASGRTGGHVAEALLAERRPVRVLVRDAAQAQAWRARGAEARVLALEDQGALREALQGATALYTLIPDQAPDRHAIIDALVASVCTHVVLLSAAPAALASGNGPCAVLHEAERRLREVSSLCALRPCMFQESVSAFKGSYFHFFGAHRLPLVATRDVAAHAVRCLLEPRTEIVDIVGPSYGGADVAAALDASLIAIPPAQHARTLMQFGLSAEMAHSIAELYACLPRVNPVGDRLVAGATTLVETIHEARRI